MKFVVAFVCFALAFVCIGLGIAQRTVFAEPDRVVAATTQASRAPVTIIDGATLNSHEGRQRIEASGGEQALAAYGRTADVMAWIGDAAYNTMSVDEESGELVSTLVPGTESEVPSAAGSDLWLGEYPAQTALSFTVNLPDDITVLIMSNGDDPAPSTVSVTWPVDNRTPWSGPLIAGGVLLLLIGIGFYIWALMSMRKLRGPRRTPPKQPKLPSGPKYTKRKAAKALKSGTARRPVESSRGRRAIGRGMIAVPMVLAGSLVMSGCTADAWPDFSAETAPSASASAEAEPETSDAVKPAVVIPTQLGRILDDIENVATAADAAKDDELLGTRFDGPALAVRTANYALRDADASTAALPAISDSPIALSLPQQSDAWPRVVLVVVQDAADATVIPTALVLEQATPRENYKVEYAVALEATDTPFPQVASAEVGAVRYSDVNRFLKLTPEEVAAAYSDILVNGLDSEYAEQFDLTDDTFYVRAGPDARAERAAAVSGPAKLVTEPVAGNSESIALATNDTGAILAINFGDKETVTPTSKNATITLSGAVKALTGLSTTKKGVFATYGYQLLFYVPPAGSTDKIRLIGATDGITSAGEL